MHNFFEVKVQYDKTMENGTLKKVTEHYLLDSLSFTESEARGIEELRPYISGEFKVADIKRSNISEIFLNDDGDRYYKAKVYFLTLDEKSGKEKRTAVQMLAQSSDIKGALDTIENGMEGTMADWEIASISETRIVDIFLYGGEAKANVEYLKES